MKRFFTAVWAGTVTFARWIGRTARMFALFVARVFLAIVRSRAVRTTVNVVFGTVRVAAWTALFAAITLVGGWLCFQRVPPGMIGVEQSNFGGAGIVPQDLETGLHFGVRGLTEFHMVDARTRVISFAWTSEGGDHPLLDVRTVDGVLAQVAISVPYRVKRGEAHLIVQEGQKSAYPQRVKSTIEKVMLEALAQLSVNDLISSDARARCTESALPALNAQLATFHVEAERVLITQVFFGNDYEKKLQQKQIAPQDALALKAQEEVQDQRQVNKLLAEDIEASEQTESLKMDTTLAERLAAGNKEIGAVDAESRDYDKRRRIEADAEYDRLVTQGERALAKAEQLKEELANEIYDSKGGRLMLARRAAQNLNIKQVTLNSNDPRVPSVLDLDALVKLMIGGGAKN